LGAGRIRRNLGLNVDDVTEWGKQAVLAAGAEDVARKGKNWYVRGDDFILTINASSHTIITAHKAKDNKAAAGMFPTAHPGRATGSDG
jgi:hypothetical protein